jgi:hypothetical protein
MTAETCTDKGCRRPPVEGSKCCEYHLAKRTRKTRKVVGAIGTALLLIVGVAIKIVSGRKS